MALLCTLAFLGAAAGLSAQASAAPQDAPTPEPTPAPTPRIIGNSPAYLPVAATVEVDPEAAPNTVAQRRGGRSRKNQRRRSLAADAQEAAPAAVVSLVLSASDLFMPTDLASDPQPVEVSLTYHSSLAGASVFVAPLDGGQINGGDGAQAVTIGSDGKIFFIFQAPARPGRYHVMTRLGATEIALPFDVAKGDAASPAPTSATN